MILVSHESLRMALAEWFIAGRAGDTLSARECAELSADDLAACSEQFFYEALLKHAPPQVTLPLAEPDPFAE